MNLICLFLRSTETAVIAGPRAQGFTEVSEEACSTRHIFQFNPKLKLFEILRLFVKGVAVTLKFKKSHLGVQLVTKLPLNYVHVSKKCVQRGLIFQLIYSSS